MSATPRVTTRTLDLLCDAIRTLGPDAKIYDIMEIMAGVHHIPLLTTYQTLVVACRDGIVRRTDDFNPSSASVYEVTA